MLNKLWPFVSKSTYEACRFMSNRATIEYGNIKKEKEELESINAKLLTQIEELKAIQDVSSLAYEKQIAKLKEENVSLAAASLSNPPPQYTSAKTFEERMNKDALIKTLETQNQRLREQINELKKAKKKQKPKDV